MLTLLSSGSNAQGQLGNGSLDDSATFQPCFFSGCAGNSLPPGTSQILEIANGANHTIALLNLSNNAIDHAFTEIWGCGDGSLGQLGAQYREERNADGSMTVFRKIALSLEQEGLSEYAPKHICATWETTYIVLSREGHGDIIISMGSDDFGDLGIGGRKKGKGKMNAEKPFHIVSFDHLAIERSHIKPESIVVKCIATGQRHVIAHIEALLTNHSTRSFAVGWGSSRHGQLGDAAGKDGKPAPFCPLPRLVLLDDPGDPVVSSSLGIHHTVFLHQSGRLSVLGSNRKSQIQNISVLQGAVDIDCTWNGTYASVRDRERSLQLLATGSNAHGQLGRGSLSDSRELLPVIFPNLLNGDYSMRFACGSEHVLALISTPAEVPSEKVSEVWAWGWNEHGNLGTGLTDDVPIPAKIWPPLGIDTQAIGIWAGNGTSWVCCDG